MKNDASCISNNDIILKVQNLRKTFQVKANAFSNKKLLLKAVDNISFDVKKGETLGLVGESGCGKTTVSRSLLRLHDSDGGRVLLDPGDLNTEEISSLDRQISAVQQTIYELEIMSPRKNKSRINSLNSEVRKLKSQADAIAAEKDFLLMNKVHLKAARQRMQMVFQDPWSSLNPRMIIRDLVSEGIREFGLNKDGKINDLVAQSLAKVGLPQTAANRYPHEFSGGQRQRIGIARALAVNPEIIICDEPVSALDVSVQAQVLNLLIDLQNNFNLTYIFIAHDLSVVQYISDRIAVMYLGRIVELADSMVLYESPRHPYTRSLLDSVPVADPEVEHEIIPLEGDIPSPVNPPSGCTFHPRCPYADEKCREVIPEFKEDESGRLYACHHPLGV